LAESKPEGHKERSDGDAVFCFGVVALTLPASGSDGATSFEEASNKAAKYERRSSVAETI